MQRKAINCIHFNWTQIVLCLFLSLSLLPCLRSIAQENPPNDKAPIISYAIKVGDIDFYLDRDPLGETVQLPPQVQKIIHSIAGKSFLAWKFPERSLAQFYGTIFQMNAPHGRQLYVFKETGPLSFTFYHFIMYDPQTKKCTQNPPNIFGKWMQQLSGQFLEKPYVYFDDLDQNGQKELVVQESVHNGSMYNAVIAHFYRINSDMSLKQLLALETRLIDPSNSEEAGIIIRDIKEQSPDRLVFKCLRRTEDGKSESLGQVVLKKNKHSVFQISSKTVLNQKYKDLLISGSEEDEDKLLREGYRFYY